MENKEQKNSLLKKRRSHAFGKDVYLLGVDEDGILYWLEEPRWDCCWYWGFGYIETYTNNEFPHASSDINSHQHFTDPLAWLMEWNGREPKLKQTPFTEDEKWSLCELVTNIYTLKKYAEICNCGGSHYTHIKEAIALLKDKEYEKKINSEYLPELFAMIDRIISPDGKGDPEKYRKQVLECVKK